jgi:hypothetical protein
VFSTLSLVDLLADLQAAGCADKVVASPGARQRRTDLKTRRDRLRLISSSDHCDCARYVLSLNTRSAGQRKAVLFQVAIKANLNDPVSGISVGQMQYAGWITLIEIFENDTSAYHRQAVPATDLPPPVAVSFWI